MHVIICQFKISSTSYHLWMVHPGSQELYSSSQSIQSHSKACMSSHSSVSQSMTSIYTTFKQLSPRYHWEGVLWNQIMQELPGNIFVQSSTIHYTPRGFSFRSFLISYSSDNPNLSKSTQWTCTDQLSFVNSEYQTSSLIGQWIFKICLSSQHACFPRFNDRQIYLLSHHKTSSGDSPTSH